MATNTCPWILLRGPRKGQPCGKKPVANSVGCDAHHLRGDIWRKDVARIIGQDLTTRYIAEGMAQLRLNTTNTSRPSVPPAPGTLAPNIPPPPYPGRS